MSQHVTITIKVAYDEASPLDDLELRLYEEIDYAVGRGLLTPSGEEIIEEFDIKVEVE